MMDFTTKELVIYLGTLVVLIAYFWINYIKEQSKLTRDNDREIYGKLSKLESRASRTEGYTEGYNAAMSHKENNK